MTRTINSAAGSRVEAVLIGGSAGALEVVSRLLEAVPADFSAALVVVIHLPRRRESLLVEALGERCRLPVQEPVDHQPLLPGAVYVAPPDYHLLIDPGPVFALSVEGPVNFSIPSIDLLLESAADVLGPACAGVLVSGANGDGARGLQAIEQAGGPVLVQLPEEAAHPAMPEAALALCSGAQPLSVEELASWLQRLGRTQSGETTAP